MLYFDAIRPALKYLTDAQCGALFRAILDYAEYGSLPELDAWSAYAFDMLRPKIDHDAERYEDIRLKRTYAVFCRESERRGEAAITFEEWKDIYYSSNDIT